MNGRPFTRVPLSSQPDILKAKRWRGFLAGIVLVGVWCLATIVFGAVSRVMWALLQIGWNVGG